MSHNNSFSFSVPAQLNQLSVICERVVTGIRQYTTPQVNDSVMYDIELAISELATNIITHAYDKTNESIDVLVTVTSKSVVIETHDSGNSFSPDEVPIPDLDRGQLHGYGIFLMRELLDDVQYIHQDGVNIWRLTKKW